MPCSCKKVRFASCLKYTCTYFTRKSIRGIIDFKDLVEEAEYQRLFDFPYMKSCEEVVDFTMFITQLGIKKIQGKVLLSDSQLRRAY